MENTKYKEVLIFLKLNYLYVIMAVVFLIILIWYVPRTVISIFDTNDKIEFEKVEEAKINAKLTTVNQYLSYDLDKLLEYVNKLVPDKGDSFSIHTTIDEIVLRDRYKLSNKNVPAEVVESQQEIAVGLNIKGNLALLPRFLENHSYQYGRFFTINTLGINRDTSEVALKLTFLTLPEAKIDDPYVSLVPPNTIMFTKLTEALSKNFSSKESQIDNPDYKSSQTPFGKTVLPTGSY